MSNAASVRLPPRSANPEAARRAIRYIAIARSAARFIPADRARELAANVAGADDDLVSLDTITESIERRRRHFALEVSDGDAAACARAIFAAWLEALA